MTARQKACLKYREKNREKLRVKSREWRSLNPDKQNRATQSWRNRNLDHFRKTRRIQESSRRSNNPDIRVLQSLRVRVGSLIRESRAVKSGTTERLTGCSLSDLKRHLEEYFKPGMTWQNYGPVWHIDHIKPCAKFDLTDSDQQRACFHWTNLQPLFVLENLQKSDKYP